MGVDKPNIRFVHHADISETLDAYYQEIGRAGRDGVPSTACLFYRPEDVGLRRFQATPAVIAERDVMRLVRSLRRTVGAISRADLARSLRMSQRRVEAMLQPLEAMGVVQSGPTGDVWGLGAGDADGDPTDVDWSAAATTVIAQHERRHRIDQSRVAMVQGYAELAGCRRQYLLNYLGEEFEASCGACDNCRSGRMADEPASLPETTPFGLDDSVVHSRWGGGRVVRVESDRLVVLFDDVGYKTLATAAVVEDGLLTRVA